MVIRKPKLRKVWNEILAEDSGQRQTLLIIARSSEPLSKPQVRRENVQEVRNLATPLGVAGLRRHKPNKMV